MIPQAIEATRVAVQSLISEPPPTQQIVLKMHLCCCGCGRYEASDTFSKEQWI